MKRVDVTTVIARPVQEVWDFFIDFTNSPRWTRSGSEVRQTSTGPLGVGSTLESVRKLFGRELKSQSIVATAFESGRLITYTTAVPLIGTATGGYTFETVADGTRMSRWTDMSLGRVDPLLGPIFARVLRSGQGTELANLKRLIEARH